jgi:phage/plasmid-like protein (TIGR03299 family)
LSIVSNRYQVVQPSEILEFYRDLTEVGGYEMETAGVLKEGRKLWALARTGHTTALVGNDRVHGYLLLATACDGTLATTAQFTSVRVVCNNTLAIALGEKQGVVKVPHRSQFDPKAVKRQLGLATATWDDFIARIRALSECSVSASAAEGFLRRELTYPASEVSMEARVVNERAVRAAHELFAGKGRGATLSSASDTAWGLVNSVTEFVDHQRQARSGDHRRDAAWFGQGAALKQRAWNEAMLLVA